MNSSTFSWELFAQAPVVGIVRHLPAEALYWLLPIYRRAGLTTIEITMNTTGAADLIRAVRQQHPDGLNVGAGTVCTISELHDALAVGAQFIVTPVLRRTVIRACVERGIPVFPGAFTPTEIYRAWLLGASMVKVYPGSALGPGYIRDLKAPLNQIKLLPTGGIGLHNLTDFRRAGADGVGVGSQLFDRILINRRDETALQAHFAQFSQAFQ